MSGEKGTAVKAGSPSPFRERGLGGEVGGGWGVRWERRLGV